MDDLGGNPRVADLDTVVGQGVLTGAAPVSAAVDHLWYFSCSQSYTTSGTVPPTSMFTSGNSGGAVSYNAGALLGQKCGALIFPQDQYGNEFNFGSSPFTIEFFFKTSGNQSAAGLMELILNGEGCFGYAIIVNEAGPGSVRFAANNGSTIGVADLTGKNYADGAWHYLVAQWSGATLKLRSANEDGSVEQAAVAFAGPIVTCSANLFLGRDTFGTSTTDGNRTFRGLIDELQIWNSIPVDSQLLGVVTNSIPPGGLQEISRVVDSAGSVSSNTTFRNVGAVGQGAAVGFNSSATFWNFSGFLQPSVATSDLDADGDGIPDWWTQFYFGHLTGQAFDLSRANDDADGDGMSNLQEYLANTDPTFGASYLHIISVAQEGNNFRLTWTVGGGRTNRVQATNGTAESFTNSFTDIGGPVIITGSGAPGSGDMITNYLDVGGATVIPSRYYRVRLVP